MVTKRRIFSAAAALAVSVAMIAPAHSETKLDITFPEPPSNFNVRQAEVFAERVREATSGEVQITVHSSGSLGVKGPEALRAVRSGIVPMAGFTASQQSGDEPFFLLCSVPNLILDMDEASKFMELARPVMTDIFEKHNQKLLYSVFWPAQIVYSKNPILALKDFAGVKIRTADRGGTDFFNALGASAIQMPWGEVVPALATGVIDGVTTSSSSGVDGKFWEFLDHVSLVNWNTTPEAITINTDVWNGLSPEHQKAITDLAAELEPVFQQQVVDENNANIATFSENGMEVATPSPEFRAEMATVAAPFWDSYVEQQGGADSPGGKLISEYRTAVGR